METKASIHFHSKLFRPEATERFGSEILLTLPKDASAKLPSKGMTMVKGSMNKSPFQAALEPDGQGSHWFKVSEKLRQATGAEVGDMVELAIEPTKDWPEPKVPANLKAALASNAKAEATWIDITPMARWDWIRWVGAARQLETRQRRVEVAISKLKSGMRRPCCFDRTECTLTDA